jgi:hypothetical protein
VGKKVGNEIKPEEGGEVEDSSSLSPPPIRKSEKVIPKADSEIRLEEGGEVGNIVPLPRHSYNPEERHDYVRTVTAIGILAIFGMTLVAAFYVVIWRGTEWGHAKELMDLILPAEMAIIGTVLGFYFASQFDKSKRL